MQKKIYLPLVLALFSGLVAAQEPAPLTIPERYSYTMGVRLGQLLKGQGIAQLDINAFAAAIDDVLGGRPLRLSDDEMRAAVAAQQRVFAEQREQRAQANLQAGQDFLAKNAGRSDIVVMPSGL